MMEAERPMPEQSDERFDDGGRGAALRALRSLEAAQARVERGAQKEADEARGKLVTELLPVLDNLDRTIAAAHGHGHVGHPAHPGEPALLTGVRMIRAQLAAVLQRFGVERVDAEGARFDPAIHEAITVTQVSDPAQDGAVVFQAEAGYWFAGRVLRPAKVAVGRWRG
jgi:molecular chaperone GrpE (heat shock protein)